MRFSFKFFFFLIYLAELEEEEESQRGRDLPCAGLLPEWPQEPGLSQTETSSFTWVAGTQTLSRSFLLFQAISRELSQKWSSQDSNWWPGGVHAAV